MENTNPSLVQIRIVVTESLNNIDCNNMESQP